MIIRGNFSRYARLYSISHKSDAAETFKQFLAGLRVEGIPSEVVVAQSDNDGEFNQGEFGQFCRKINIKQEFTTADSPVYNGVAGQGLAMIESATLAARIQASQVLPGFDIPEKPSLWAEAMSWTCDAYNRTATGFMYVCMYVWSSHIAEYGSAGKVANPASGQLNRENNIPLSPCVPENLVSRDGFSRPVPRQPAYLHTQAKSGAYLQDPSRVPRRRPFMKSPYAVGSVPILSGHAHIGENSNNYSKSQGQPIRDFDRPGRHDARRGSLRCDGVLPWNAKIVMGVLQLP